MYKNICIVHFFHTFETIDIFSKLLLENVNPFWYHSRKTEFRPFSHNKFIIYTSSNQPIDSIFYCNNLHVS